MPARDKMDVHGTEDLDQQGKRRSFFLSGVGLCLTGFVIAHIISLKRHAKNYERFYRQGESGPAGSQQTYQHGHRSGENHGNASGQTRIYRFSYYTADGEQRTFYIHRNEGEGAGPWARVFQDDGFYSKEEVERLERMRRMTEAYHRGRSQYTRTYEKWQEEGEKSGGPQTQPRDDWSWTKADWEAWKNATRGRYETFPGSPNSKYYETLGLDGSNAVRYSQEDIKAAYRAKAMEYHPDRNQHRKEYAEAKFREVVAAYEALKQ
ncbi:hypothetical protein KP509_02G098600 [Ceratopteris richardii]|uniref:J domain-containing protein n=1 Tax=Ceratopteris richardii TaxID=49495 RepID=A0A8T2VCK6_CERRI|nr:hypothetical protein KP509_02G098600 [Ceratopteris richardii]